MEPEGRPPVEEVAAARREKAPARVSAPGRERSDHTLLGWDPERRVIGRELAGQLPRATLDFMMSRSPQPSDLAKLPDNVLAATEAPSRAWTEEMGQWSEGMGGVDNLCTATAYFARAMNFLQQGSAKYNIDRRRLVESRSETQNLRTENQDLKEGMEVLTGVRDELRAELQVTRTRVTELEGQNAELENRYARLTADYDKLSADFSRSVKGHQTERASFEQLRNEMAEKLAAMKEAGAKEYEETMYIPGLHLAYVYAFADAAEQLLKMNPGVDISPFRDSVLEYMREHNVAPEEVDLGVLAGEAAPSSAQPTAEPVQASAEDVEIIIVSEPAEDQPAPPSAQPIPHVDETAPAPDQSTSEPTPASET